MAGVRRKKGVVPLAFPMIPEGGAFTILYAARYRGMNETAAHTHILFQLIVLCSDELELYDGSTCIRPDWRRELLLIKPGQAHDLHLRVDSDVEDWLAPGINCALDCKFAVKDEALAERLKALPTCVPVGDTSFYLRLSEVLLAALGRGEESTAYSALNVMLASLTASPQPEETADTPCFFSSNRRQDADISGIHAVHRYIELHYREPIALEQLIRLSCVNRSTRCRKFRAAYGTTPMHYVQSLRLREAELLLRETSVEMGELAERLGFASAAYFNRVFRRTHGVTPGQYRRSPAAVLHGPEST